MKTLYEHYLRIYTCLIQGFIVTNNLFTSSGTREEKTKKVDDVPWYETLWAKIKYIFTCCRPEPAPQPHSDSSVDGRVAGSLSGTSGEVNIFYIH